MKPQLKSSPAARELIQRFEPYREIAAQSSDGRWSVGFGHRAAARDGVQVSREDAALLLIYDVMQAEAVIDEMFPAPLPKTQRDALTSFVHDIGAAAFRNSDVARYMFEGRVEAAAEALASYGEGPAERREAESGMLLAGLRNASGASAPARKPALVDLVIKVEHPGDNSGVATMPARSRPALPDSIMPPPPPPEISRQAVARREAESEIARILATVGAMPLEDEPPQPETDAGASAAEPVAESLAKPVIEPVVEVVDEPAVVAGPAVEPADETVDEAVEALVPDAEADVAGESAGDTEGASGPGGELESGAALESEADAAPAAPVSAQVIARMSQEIANVQTAAIGREDSDGELPAGDEALPDGVSLGYVFTGSMRVAPDLKDEAVSLDEAVEDEAAQPVILPEAEAEAEAGAEAEADPELEAAPELVSGSEPESGPEPEAESDAAGAADSDTIDTQAEDLQATIAGDNTGDNTEVAAATGPVDLVPAAAAIVERALAVAGDRTPPPHPADEPATSEGAVGDIAGESAGADGRSETDHIAHIDDLAGSPDALLDETDEDDAFSPRDLVGNADLFVDTKPAEPRKEEGGWGFVVTLIAGLVVTGAGILDIYGDWPRVWLERDPTWGMMAAVAGGFLVVTASWMLWSVLSAKARRKRGT